MTEYEQFEARRRAAAEQSGADDTHAALVSSVDQLPAPPAKPGRKDRR